MTDTRVVYGARCEWWDTIDRVGKMEISGGHSLPCCPHCRGVLLELPSIGKWWEDVDGFEAAGHPGYRAYIEWRRGRCLPTGKAKQTYENETGRKAGF